MDTSGFRIVTRKFLFDSMKSQTLRNIEEKLCFLKDHLLSPDDLSEEQINKYNSDFAHFKTQVKQRWSKAHKKEKIFLKNNALWLEGTFEIPIRTPNHPGPGRPRKSFEESSERSKRRRTQDLRSNVEDGSMILHAAQVQLSTMGKRDASSILKNIVSSPTRATRYKKAIDAPKCANHSRLSPMEALQMFVDADLSQRQYEIIRQTNKKFFPCYSLIQEAKKECYPPPETCTVNSNRAETQLQAVVDITVRRLSIFLEDVLSTVKEQDRRTLKLFCKWGCDGSQQAQFKQKLEHEGDSDGNIFQSCFVPLRLVCGKNNEKVLWQNPTPSSPRFCRPIRFRFIKETNDVTIEEINFVQNSIDSLIATEVNIGEKKFYVNYQFVMTMVDGKVCNAATGTASTSRCYICGKTSKDFNQLDDKRETSKAATEFGLSILHARIRFFESILHLAYKLPVKKYRGRRTEDEKKIEREKKLEIQTRFRNETGLLVDMPKTNFGNTNDGNTSRRFFEDPKLASEITGIDYELIFRLKVILEAISSGYSISTEKFNKYAEETAQLYVKLYPWHPMTPTLHKVLIHGSEIIKNALLPIGQLSEEAAEARNKHFRAYRQDFARKFSRESCNQDILNRLLLSSDPLLSASTTKNKRKFSLFLPETIEMFLSAQPNLAAESDVDDEISDDGE